MEEPKEQEERSHKRHLETRDSRWSLSEPSSDDPTLILCPKCSKLAKIFPMENDAVRAVCEYCNFQNAVPNSRRAFAWYDENPTDGYFGYDLFLQTPCAGKSLWVFNLRHLKVLEEYVGAQLRERANDPDVGWSNSSLTSRLPKWLKSAKNKKAILKGILKLKKKLEIKLEK